MGNDGEILGQLGLMLTQLGRARRALEDIERSTARYAGLSFAPLLAASPRFGEPPLLGGALRVYVVNINDLSPGGTSIGAFFGNLLGGLGSLLGGLIGGISGGFVGALALPDNLRELRRITEAMVPIVKTLDEMDKRKGTGKQIDEGPSILDRLPQLTTLVRSLTALLPPLTELVKALGDALPRLVSPIERLYKLFVGGEKKDKKEPAAETSGPPIDWEKVLASVHQIVKGLTQLIPIAIGGISFLIAHLRDIQRAITDLLTWALRLVFLLRGSLLIVIFDTLAAAARVGVEILGILGAAAERVLSAVFTAFERALLVATELLRKLATSLSTTITKLFQWLVDNLFKVLTALGELRVFKLLFRIVEGGYALLSILHAIITGKPMAAPPTPPSGGSGTPGGAPGPTPGAGTAVAPPTPPKITGPDLAEAILPLKDVADLGYAYSSAAAQTYKDIQGAVGDARKAVGKLGSDAARQSREGAFASGPLQTALGNLRKNANDLGSALERARENPAEAPRTGLEVVAKAFEDWLEKGGMETLFVGMVDQFQKGPTSGPGAAGSVPGQIVGAAAEAIRAAERTDVAIGELVIEIEPPPPPQPAGPTSMFSREMLEEMLEQIHLDRALRDPFYTGLPA